MDEPLLDFAQAACALRHDGYSEQQIARAAGFPDLCIAPRHTPAVDHIIELVWREPTRNLHAEDLEWRRDIVRRVLAVVRPAR